MVLVPSWFRHWPPWGKQACLSPCHHVPALRRLIFLAFIGGDADSQIFLRLLRSLWRSGGGPTGSASHFSSGSEFLHSPDWAVVVCCGTTVYVVEK